METFDENQMKDAINVAILREDFPILKRKVNNAPLVYLDNAATTQKPRQVVESISEMYYTSNANVHRGTHELSMIATRHHEDAREAVRNFIHARDVSEIVFTRGTTESINLVARTYGDEFMREGDEIIVSVMEHHSNIVPWQQLAQRKGIKIKVIPINFNGELSMEKYEKLFTDRTRLVCVTHVSNVLGTINPVAKMAQIAHKYNVPILLDGAQAMAHMKVDVQAIDADFYAFSSHKMYGPTGVGVLYGKEKWLDRMPVYQGGGEMIERVTFEKTTYNKLPYKFEAGTPDYIGTAALAKAIAYIERIGIDHITAYEQKLTAFAYKCLNEIEGMQLYGHPENRAGIFSFTIHGIHSSDIGTMLDKMGFAVRVGHLCAQPLLQHLGQESMVRASLSFYNTTDEVGSLKDSLVAIQEMLNGFSHKPRKRLKNPME
jgi:cysteine desulfurase/selenocysteine lyase